MTDPLRDNLIDRLRRLPAAALPQVEALLSRLECGDSPLDCGNLSPLSLLPSPNARSTTHQQRLAAQVSAATKEQRKESGDESSQSKAWPHAPVHHISEHGMYIVTAGTLGKQHFFCGPERLDTLEDRLLTIAKDCGWDLEAWAVFSNHYHFVGNSRPDSVKLNQFLSQLHAETAIEINAQDHQPGRQVWFNYWDTQLTFEKSYLARLNYVHQNTVRHGLVPVANQYRWCSAAWFERTASRAQVATIYGFKIDRIKIVDDYDPL